jgi:ATP-binding cassette subfamily B protein
MLGTLNGHIEEMITGHMVLKAFGKEKDSIETFKKYNEDLFETGWRAQFLSGVIMPAMQIISNIGYVFLCVIGGMFVIRGQVTVGTIQAFIQYSKRFYQPIVQTANIANLMQSTIASAERVFEVLDEKEEEEPSNNVKDLGIPKGNVSFEHVAFGYNVNKPLMKDLSFQASPGQTIAIVGPTGAGKTTLVNLLMRFYEIQKGAILIDGIDIREIKREELHRIFGMVLQDTWLFNGTIRDNIGYACDNPTEERIIEAAKAANADYFIRTLPEGYDTMINEEASNISQGQKQLLTIARAILANPSILILDEATSSVDTRTEIMIQKAMKSLIQNRTSFVIAHRLSTIKDADLILVMRDGDIIEQGSHEALLKMNGFYAELYYSQFSTDQRAV